MEVLHYFGAAIGLGIIVVGAGLGIGRFAAAAADGIARQPELQAYLLGQFFIMMALIDALPIISLAFGLIQLFG